MFMHMKAGHCLNIQNQKKKLCTINIIRQKYRFSEGQKISKFLKYKGMLRNRQLHRKVISTFKTL